MTSSRHNIYHHQTDANSVYATYVAPAAEKAYIAERQGQDWIAAVDNYPQVKVNFVPS
ncbi:hypothetical protein QMY64_24420 [Phocaeicola dorei]|nr:hypothetical protein QMY64_24420 [Phocaeicola dorei]